jgi:5-methylcytosine-specific restriction endonuclease McrA
VPGRKVELVLHLTDTALTGADSVGRCGNTRTPISPEQIRDWLNVSGTTLVVRPVLDLADCRPVDSYEIPDRLRRQVTLRDHHCVYPYCTRSAEACDLDHIHPHAQGGATCGCNLAALCRGHHRFKTSGAATYRMLSPGSYRWSIGGRQWLVDPHGTRPLPPDPPDPPEE